MRREALADTVARFRAEHPGEEVTVLYGWGFGSGLFGIVIPERDWGCYEAMGDVRQTYLGEWFVEAVEI